MKVFGLVRVVADPVLKDVGNTQVCEFSVVQNYYRKDKDGNSVNEPSFFNCVAWDSGGKIIAERFKKGNRMMLEGTLKQERWEDTEGNKKNRVVIRVNEFSMVDFEKKADEQQPAV